MVDLTKPCPRCGKPDPGGRHWRACETLPEGVDPDSVMLDVSVDDGKYRLIYHADAKTPQAFRHGEPWPAFEATMLGSKVIMALAFEIDALREKVNG